MNFTIWYNIDRPATSYEWYSNFVFYLQQPFEELKLPCGESNPGRGGESAES